MHNFLGKKVINVQNAGVFLVRKKLRKIGNRPRNISQPVSHSIAPYVKNRDFFFVNRTELCHIPEPKDFLQFPIVGGKYCPNSGLFLGFPRLKTLKLFLKKQKKKTIFFCFSEILAKILVIKIK